jgi:hypothetical protein
VSSDFRRAASRARRPRIRKTGWMERCEQRSESDTRWRRQSETLNDLFFRTGFRRLAEVPMGLHRARLKEPEGRVQTHLEQLTSEWG